MRPVGPDAGPAPFGRAGVRAAFFGPRPRAFAGERWNRASALGYHSAMTRTARRRWTRELTHEVDGIVFGERGPVLVHGYEPPAGGKWMDDAIPGKLSAFDRTSGESLWNSPCEIGYGRGFGAGFGAEDDVLVLGPTSVGHGIARMRLETGELLGAREIEFFDEACVAPDQCVCVSPKRVFGVLSTDLVESWVYSRKGERYHMVSRVGELVFVVYTHIDSKKQGVLCLHAETGERVGVLIEPCDSRMHGIVGGANSVVLALDNLEYALPPTALTEWFDRTSNDEPASGGSAPVGLLALTPGTEPGAEPLWFEQLSPDEACEFDEISLRFDAGRLYVARGAMLDVLDGLTGRSLGRLTLPGLDEFVSWGISEGAALLAEETRVSVFEVPD